MLASLHIRNLALVEDLTIAFDRGLNVLTGETGAGKSILVGAIGLVLGHRADSLLVRKDAQEASVEAVFSLSGSHRVWDIAREAGIVCDSAEDLVIRRVVQASGKSRAFINDQAVALGTLERLVATMLDLVGQHSHQALLKEEAHCELLDAFGRHEDLREALRAAFAEVQSLEVRLADLERQEKDKQEKLEFYRFQSREITAAQLRAQEDEELAQEMDLLSHAQKWQELATTVLEGLYEGEDSITHRVGAVQAKLSAARQADAMLEEAATHVQEAFILLKEAAESVRAFGEKLNADPQRLNAVQERLSVLEGLKRRHGRSLEEILAMAKEIGDKIAALENISVTMEETEGCLAQARQKLAGTAAKLSTARAAVAEKMSSQIRAQLRDLGMEGVGLKIELESCPISEAGAEVVRFLVAPNKGEGFKPLAAIASGGEMSRILLAIKIVFSAADNIPTLVFDEVDANIGGTVAVTVGQKLRGLASSGQILAITHLPQIAHQATAHFQVTKQVLRGRTLTQIRGIEGKERKEELARMMGGEDIARELLKGQVR